MDGGRDLAARFFKVLLPSTTSLFKLRIPIKFARKYGDELNNIARLSDSVGGVWCVRLEKADDALWFHHGWDKFVKDHSVSYGYFILFEYTGNSNFNVHVFDLTATDVVYTSKLDHQHSDSDDTDLEIISSVPAKPVLVRREQKTNKANESNFEHSYRTRSKVKIEEVHWKSKTQNLDIPANNENNPTKVIHSRRHSGRTNNSTSRPVIFSEMEEHSDDTSLEILSSLPGKQVERRSDHKARHGLPFSSTDFSHKVKRAKIDLPNKSEFETSYLTRSKVKMEKAELTVKKERLDISANNENKPKNSTIKNVREAIRCSDWDWKPTSNVNQPSFGTPTPVGAVRKTSSKNPSFAVLLQPYNLSRKVLYMRRSFYTENMPSSPEKLELHDGDGNKWVVGVISVEGQGCRVSQGLESFFKDKKLKAGDTCVFELIHFNKPLLKVSVFRK